MQENNPFRMRDLFKAELSIRDLMEEVQELLQPEDDIQNEVEW